MILSAVAAMAANRVIGVDNDLPWNLPEDLQFFKEKTKASIMIMGRKTFESIQRPLPGRFHIVITRNADYHYDHERVKVVTSLEGAVKLAQTMIPPWPNEVFIVGGGEIYRQALNVTDRIYLTRIEREYQGHAQFPEFESTGQFTKTDSRPALSSTSAEAGIPRYNFETWIRNQTPTGTG